jgi:uncharacterized membrane protein YphA (DoxX/SURF4 family)
MNLSRFGEPLLLVLRLALGVTMLWAGLSKVSETALFALTVRAYDVLPQELVHGFAIVVPWIEILLGICLVVGFWVRGSGLASAVLLASFGVAIGVNLFREADITCGCFGLDGAAGSLTDALIRDILMIVASVILYCKSSRILSVDLFLRRDR